MRFRERDRQLTHQLSAWPSFGPVTSVTGSYCGGGQVMARVGAVSTAGLVSGRHILLLFRLAELLVQNEKPAPKPSPMN